MRSYLLKRQCSVPGHAVIRYGNWRKREPTVVLENRRWLHMGKPEYVRVEFTDDEISDSIEAGGGT